MFAGGGTGGHIYPALAIAGELLKRKSDTEIIFVAGTRGIERSILEKAGYRMETISVASLPRRLSPSLLTFAWKLGTSTLAARSYIKAFKPSVVIATGGYVSGPPILAARLCGVPVVIQEQNSYPGITTKKLARFADTVMLGFADAAKHFGKSTKTIETGNPVRNAIGTAVRESSSPLFGFDPAKKTVLVFGGSQGAHALNVVMTETAPMLADRGFQVLWQTGRLDYDSYRSFDGYGGGLLKVTQYIDDMVSAYGASDMVVSRAGAMTVAEITRCGLPSVLVPLPTAAENHQEFNARSLAYRGAAVVLLERNLTPGLLETTVSGILGDDNRYKTMADASKNLGEKDAAGNIADMIIERYARS